MSYSTPLSAPLQRGSMTPLPWAGPPLRRLFGRRGDQPWRNPGDRRPLMARRLLLLVLVAVCAVLGTNTMVDILPNRGATWLEQSLLVLFAVLFAWISAGFWTAVMGLVLLWRAERRPLELKVGDKVIFGKYSGQTVKVDGDEVLVMREEDVMGIVE